MSLTAMWTHGNSVSVETQESLPSIFKRGFGTDMVLKPGQECWTHAAIPTPTVLRVKRATLLRVFVLFKTNPPPNGQGFLKEIHVYDGIGLLFALQHIDLRGEHLTVDTNSTFPLPEPRQIFTGVGISMHWLNFNAPGVEGTGNPQPVLIAAVGADFEIPD